MQHVHTMNVIDGCCSPQAGMLMFTFDQVMNLCRKWATT
jgi:hypothetical protein